VSSSPGDERSIATSARGTVYVAALIPSGGAHVTARAASPILRYFSLGPCAFEELLVGFSRAGCRLPGTTIAPARHYAHSAARRHINRSAYSQSAGRMPCRHNGHPGVPSMTGAAVTDVREFLDRATSVFRTRPVTLVTLRSRGQAAYIGPAKSMSRPGSTKAPFASRSPRMSSVTISKGPAWRRLAVRRSVREAEQYRRETDANVSLWRFSGASTALASWRRQSECTAFSQQWQPLKCDSIRRAGSATKIGASSADLLAAFRSMVRISCGDVRPRWPCDSNPALPHSFPGGPRGERRRER
jgi:hypothetical protein